MSVLQTYPFNNALDYNKVNTEVSGGGVTLSLIENPGQLFQQTFDSDSGFTYNPALSEFVGGLVRQKDQTPSGSVLAALYDSSVNADWNKSGSTTATLNGTPTIVSNRLQCFGTHGVSYSISANGGKGTIKLKYKPNYSGAPSTNINVFSISNAANGNSRVALTHSPSGDNFRIFLTNESGAAIYSAATITANNINISSANTYELQLTWDNDAGVIRFFIDGVNNAARTLTPGPWVHGTGAGLIRIGASTLIYNVADASFEDAVYYSVVTHTASYTPGYTLPLFIYASNTVQMPAFSYTGIGTIQAVESSIITEGGTPRFTVAGLYWNGTSWIPSDGTYTQANPSATIIANLTSLNVTGATTVPVNILFTNSNSLSSVDLISVTLTGQKYSPTGYLEPVTPLPVRSIVNYSQVETLPAGNTITVILKIDNVLTWFDGESWVESDGSVAQSNTPADVATNVATLDLGANSSVFIRWLLATDSNTETPILDEATVEYEFGAIEIDAETCIVFGYVKDYANVGVPGVTIVFSGAKASEDEPTSAYNEAHNNVVKKPVTVTTDENGYFSTPLIRTSEFSVGGTYKVTMTKEGEFSITKNLDDTDLTFTVPDAETKDITDLLPSVA